MAPSPASSDPIESEAAPGRVKVLLPLALPGPLDYRAVAGPACAPGAIVRVPLGPRERIGVVWDPPEGDRGTELEPARIKEVLDVLDAPPLPATLRRFIDWVAAYTMAAPGAVLRMAISVPEAFKPEPTVPAYAAVPGWRAPDGFRMTPARARVLAALEQGPPLTAGAIREQTGAGASVVKGLVAAGALEVRALAAVTPLAVPDPALAGPALSPAQTNSAAALRERVGEGAFSVTLLDGVTGSGKTEVYLEAIAEALERRRRVLVLVPEIALTAQWLERFAERFGAEPALWHSELTPAKRRRTWRQVAEGRAQVVVGARSALFLPLDEVGLIVVDEEHDASYKQEEGVFYNARDMAVVRGQLSGAAVVLASATPSLETVVNAERGRYARLHLPERIGAATLPDVSLIDLRRDPPERGRWLSPPLVDAVAETLDRQEQALLFLNRRGYAPLTLCRGCGLRLECPNCSAWLVEHRLAARLTCHHCGHQQRRPEACPHCGTEGAFVACGPGVERVMEEVAMRFPEARARVLASDTLAGPDAMARVVAEIREGGIDILIGTQVIAKGHHFPRLTLAGIVDGDIGLTGGDLRASERTHQLLTQVTGRAGRAEHAGRALIQTHMPDHPVMAALASGDRDAFLDAEKAERAVAKMPPFGRLAAVIVSGPNEDEVDGTARLLGRARPDIAGVEILGPAPAALSLLRGRHRRRFLIKGGPRSSLQSVIRPWLAAVKPGRGVRIQVDIDPLSFL